MASVSDILRKPKSTEVKDDKDDKGKDAKKLPKTNALLTFIAEKKKIGKSKD